MKLLFDHNLPPLLVSRLANLFPQSQHVFALGLDRASDLEIREYARQKGYSIITKDADFSEQCVRPRWYIGTTILERRLRECV